jgi:hypothetical protein
MMTAMPSDVMQAIINLRIYPDEARPTQICIKGLRNIMSLSATSRQMNNMVQEITKIARECVRALFYCERCDQIFGGGPYYNKRWCFSNSYQTCYKIDHNPKMYLHRSGEITSQTRLVCNACYVHCAACGLYSCGDCAARHQLPFAKCLQCRRFYCTHCQEGCHDCMLLFG